MRKLLLVAVLLAAASAVAEPPKIEMTKYHIVFLRRGPAWTAEQTPEVKAILDGHFKNMQRLAAEGKLVVAGPFLDQSGEKALAGLFIFRIETMDAAKALVETDPAVKAGRFVYDIVPWLGPKSLHY